MSSARLAITPNVDKVLSAFLESPDEDMWGYLIRQRTGLAPGRVYEVLARLERVGWVVRSEGGGVSEGPARVTYRLAPNELSTVRHERAAASLRRSRTEAAQARLRPQTHPGT